MMLNIELSANAEASLRQRAADTGQPVAQYVAELVEQAATRPSLEELLAPVQADFAQSGMTEGELLDLGRELLDEVRDKKAGR